MLRWPAEVKPGVVSDALVCQMDLLASLSALIGQTYSDKVDSQNTLPVFLGKGGNGRKELVLEGYFNYALRDGDWVMIPPYPDTYGDAEEAAFAGNSNCYQLYNVKEDIGQQVNLAEKEPKRLREAKKGNRKDNELLVLDSLFFKILNNVLIEKIFF